MKEKMSQNFTQLEFENKEMKRQFTKCEVQDKRAPKKELNIDFLKKICGNDPYPPPPIKK